MGCEGIVVGVYLGGPEYAGIVIGTMDGIEESARLLFCLFEQRRERRHVLVSLACLNSVATSRINHDWKGYLFESPVMAGFVCAACTAFMPGSNWRTCARWLAMLSFCLVRSLTSRWVAARRRSASALTSASNCSDWVLAWPAIWSAFFSAFPTSCLACWSASRRVSSAWPLALPALSSALA